MTKYIFITGGVCSSLGKGIAASSIGAILEAMGYKVAMQKIDPYLNVDAGTMSPYQHGEVYVTDDGAETDLDLGNYARFTDSELSKLSSITTGKVYLNVIERERRGDYLGKTVQVIPHVTSEIQRLIRSLSDKVNPDVQIVEIGGTVGDIESIPFLEAAREFSLSNKNNTIFIHLTLIPKIEVAGEYKTKPTQHSVGVLRQIGIVPDIIMTRISGTLSKEMKRKIAMFCSIAEEDVFEAPDVDSIYKLPIIYTQQGLQDKIALKLSLASNKPNLKKWEEIISIVDSKKPKISIAVVGKYIKLQDSYKSVYEALRHAAIANKVELNIMKIDSEEIEKNPENLTKVINQADGILVPGGFGSRGIEGKLAIIQIAREKKIPYFGICLGMQCMVIEYARNVLKIADANSSEFTETSNPVIHLMEDQYSIDRKGGTMRLGVYECNIKKGTLAEKIYDENIIFERHRHRYEFNNKYEDQFEKAGLIISGKYITKNLVEIVEYKDNPFGIGVQFHPEFKSKPFKPHPIFKSFIENAYKYNIEKK
ncbi:MAG: CTP synthase [Exilispira sp.]|jgi:CTP synthase|nr:CTP synthase [Exilispira sp.]